MKVYQTGYDELSGMIYTGKRSIRKRYVGKLGKYPGGFPFCTNQEAIFCSSQGGPGFTVTDIPF
jgi:hypothetical protein